MASDDKEYEQSALGKRVNELMDDGYDFGEAVKQAMSEGLKDGGSVGIEILFKNKMADGGRVGFKGGGHQDFPPFKGPKGKKRGFENVMDGPDAGIAARAYLAEQQQQKQLQQAKAIAPTPKPNLENINYIRQSMNQYGFSEPEILKAITQAGYADGGRVGLFMGGDPLTGQALAIYNSMNAYGFDDQAIANALQEQGLYTPPGSSTPETTTPNIIGSQINQGGGDGPKGDFGIFGNLLKDTAKEFNVQTYDEELGDFIDTKITGYKNVNSGLYQDKFGKNLEPMFSNKGQAFGLSGIIAQALGLTPDTVGGYVPGSIKGKYDGITDMFGSIKNFNLKNPFDFFKKQQATIADINAANLKAKQELDAKLAAEAAAAALQQQMQNTGVTGSNYNQAANIAGGGGGNTARNAQGQTAREATYDGNPNTGTAQGYSQHYARGGLATMFKEKR